MAKIMALHYIFKDIYNALRDPNLFKVRTLPSVEVSFST